MEEKKFFYYEKSEAKLEYLKQRGVDKIIWKKGDSLEQLISMIKDSDLKIDEEKLKDLLSNNDSHLLFKIVVEKDKVIFDKLAFLLSIDYEQKLIREVISSEENGQISEEMEPFFEEIVARYENGNKFLKKGISKVYKRK